MPEGVFFDLDLEIVEGLEALVGNYLVIGTVTIATPEIKEIVEVGIVIGMDELTSLT